MTVKVRLVDINPKMIAAWRSVFENNPEVDIVHGSMIDQVADAWVTPTNSAGRMGGGLDGVIKRYLGSQIEQRVQGEIKRLYHGKMPVGSATCVLSGSANPRYLISSPTMSAGREDISDSLNVALACGAAFQAVLLQNQKEPDSIKVVALPGLGAANGKTPVEICADLMWTAYNIFHDGPTASFADMQAALEEQLGDLSPSTPKPKPQPQPLPKPAQPLPKPAVPPPPPTPSVKKADIDFDDAG
jgi:O-acetyl-ADP-ribose deacetylase (regulator of RNase III)